MKKALEETARVTLADMQKETEAFYSVPEGEYHRTGLLGQSPTLEYLQASGNHAEAMLTWNRGYSYLTG